MPLIFIYKIWNNYSKFIEKNNNNSDVSTNYENHILIIRLLKLL